MEALNVSCFPATSSLVSYKLGSYIKKRVSGEILEIWNYKLASHTGQLLRINMRDKKKPKCLFPRQRRVNAADDQGQSPDGAQWVKLSETGRF